MESGGDNIPSEQYRPLASPKAPITDDQNRPVSVISTSARSAKIVAAPPSPTRSVNTEIYEDNLNRTIDRFDEPSSEEDGGNYQDLDRFGAISLYSKRSKKEQPAQSPSDRFRQSSGLNISQPIAVASSTGFRVPTLEIRSTMGVQPHHDPQPSDASIQSSGNSQRFSTLEVDDSVSPSTWTGMRNVGKAVSTDLPSPAEHPTASDRHPSISPLPSRESTIRRSFGRSFLTRPTLASTDPTSVESNAPREVGGFRLPFLHGMPNFLRPSGYAKSSLTPSEEKEVKDAAQPPGSFFHDGSSYGEPDDEGSQIDSAQQVIVGNPVMVKHGSRTKVGLKEMLHTVPFPQHNPGPSRAKAMSMIGENSEFGRKPMISGDSAFPVRKPSKREGVIGMPQEEQEDTMSQNQEDQVGLGIFHNTNPFANDGLRSHPVSPKHVSPLAPPHSKRTVSFPSAPPQLDIKPEHRFLRQDIVSTPYPPGFKGRAASLYNPSEHVTMPTTDEAPKSLLTLVLYSHGDSTSKVKKIVIPTPPETALVDNSDEKKPPIKATLHPEFDDEKLFKLIHSEYNSMRGSLRRLASARTVRSMNLLAYCSTSELVSKQAKPMHFRLQDNDEYLAEARMLDLFKKPKLGKRHNEWVEWVTKLPENSTIEPIDNERIALELVEGWSTRKFLAAVVAVLVCSLTITLLWIFLGAGGNTLGFESSNVSLPGGLMGSNAATVESPVGFKGAGGRVETGVALGILVLMFGWTSIGAWILLNWLVM
ncbi:MAG: hypothetical protein Q9175_006087 [Cornicularia normoerica]